MCQIQCSPYLTQSLSLKILLSYVNKYYSAKSFFHLSFTSKQGCKQFCIFSCYGLGFLPETFETVTCFYCSENEHYKMIWSLTNCLAVCIKKKQTKKLKQDNCLHRKTHVFCRIFVHVYMYIGSTISLP